MTVQSFEIKTHNSGDVLWQGMGESFKDVLEQAVREGICLDYADFRHANLVNVNLDDAVIRHARFAGANLTGANMSEAVFEHSDFSCASLGSACLCYSSFTHCSFEGSSFGGTDIAGACLDQCRFSGLSSFTLGFHETEKLARCCFVDISGTLCPFVQAPLVLNGLTYPVIFLDAHIKVGNVLIPFEEWGPYLSAPHAFDRFEQAHIHAFLWKNRALLSAALAQRFHRREKEQLVAA